MNSERASGRLRVRRARVAAVCLVAVAGCGWVAAADGVANIDLQEMVSYVNLDFANPATGLQGSIGDTPFSVVAAEHLKFTTDLPGEFYDDFLEPRMASQLWEVRNGASYEMMDPAMQNDQARRDVAYQTVKCIERAGRYAAGDYFLALTGLEHRGRKVAENIAGGIVSSTTDAGKPKRIRYRLGAYHFLPKVGIDYRIGGGRRLMVNVAAAGSVDVEFTHIRRKWAILGVGYVHENRFYNLNARFSF